MGIAGHTLQERELWRTPPGASDDMGGTTDLPAELVDTVEVKVDEPSAVERFASGSFQGQYTNNVYGDPALDVRRGDEFRAEGKAPLRVLAVTRPSRPDYVKAMCEALEEATV